MKESIINHYYNHIILLLEDELYDSVENPPMRTCPAGPPPLEPVYAQPIKTNGKKKKQKNARKLNNTKPDAVLNEFVTYCLNKQKLCPLS